MTVVTVYSIHKRYNVKVKIKIQIKQVFVT